MYYVRQIKTQPLILIKNSFGYGNSYGFHFL